MKTFLYTVKEWLLVDGKSFTRFFVVISKKIRTDKNLQGIFFT